MVAQDSPFFSPLLSLINQSSITQQIFICPITRNPEIHTILDVKLNWLEYIEKVHLGENSKRLCPRPQRNGWGSWVHRPRTLGSTSGGGTREPGLPDAALSTNKGNRQQCWWGPWTRWSWMMQNCPLSCSLGRDASHIRGSSAKAPVTLEAPAVMIMHQAVPLLGVVKDKKVVS